MRETKSVLLSLVSATIALASFGPNVRIDDKLPGHSYKYCAITVGPGAPSCQPLYVVFVDQSALDDIDVVLQKSTDAGRTWLPTAVLVRDGAPQAYGPDITTDSDGNVYIAFEDVYSDSAGGYGDRIACVHSSDGGTTWTAPARVDDRPDLKRMIGQIQITADSARNLLCVWFDRRTGDEGHIWSSVSTDQGATWSPNVQVDDDTTGEGVGQPDVFVQPGTNHYLVAAAIPRRVGSHWESGTALYRSTDMGLTFQPGVQIDTFRHDARHAHIVADRDHIICDYFADHVDGRPTLDTLFVEARTFYTQGDSWGTPARITNLDSLHVLYYSARLALSGDGRVHTALSVCDTADWRYDVFYASSSDHGVSWSNIELVTDDTTADCDWPDIGADSTGHAYVVWYGPNVGEGEVWFATNAPLGIAEETSYRPTVATVANAPTVVRGVLFLPKMGTVPSGTVPLFGPALLDVGGRKVMDLHPGANDVRALAPGIYFVRTGPSAVSRQPSAVTKVVVAR